MGVAYNVFDHLGLFAMLFLAVSVAAVDLDGNRRLYLPQ